MQIIAGSLKRRSFELSAAGFHPMGERIKSALFNTLGDIDGLAVVDAYAGSGALSFECLSRGASSVTAVDIDPLVCQKLRQNGHSLGLTEQLTIIRSDVGLWAKDNSHNDVDLVLADPPYDSKDVDTLERLVSLIKPSGLMVLSWPANQLPPKLVDTSIVKSKTYAGAQLVFYRRLAI